MDIEVTIRDEKDDDTDVVDVLVGKAFGGRQNEVALVRGLRNATERQISRVAVHAGAVVGHAMLSPLGMEGSDTCLLSLAPLSVAPEFQGKGIGGRLVVDAISVADRCLAPLLVVLGDPGYYGHFGFEPASRYGIEPPRGVSHHGFMVRCLSSSGSSGPGRVVYPRLFADTGTL